ncbi:hypothetical protein [Stutzerimonas xanthomarina]|uniref:hypothetical protein n=1 Tax=Stutzerimonas xanthomarina TaxID=271420 RepID=UPI003AA80D48
MQDYYYKSQAPETVAIVQEYYRAKDQFQQQLDALGQLFGGAVAPMHDITSHYAGGVKLSASRELDMHWCRPDEWGYRRLRTSAVPPKGISKEERAAIRAEHERLDATWTEHCPPRLSKHDYWDRLGVNTGNLLLCGGVMFEHGGLAYFHLGFEINKADHDEKVATGKPTSGWIEGAVEILPSELQAARVAKLEERRA